MKKVKPMGSLLTFLIVFSFLLAGTYILNQVPSIAREVHGADLPTEFYVYNFFSGIVYTGALIGITLRKRMATYPFVAIILLDSVMYPIFTPSPEDTILNLLLAAVWIIVLKRKWVLFK